MGEIMQSSPAVITYGSYTGNGGNSLAVPHCLGQKPKGVYLIRDNATAGLWMGIEGLAAGLAVTPWDTTNIYVGNVANLVTTCNENATGYHFTAMA